MTAGCRNTWQYDTYYQHCWWESFVRTYGEVKGGCSESMQQLGNKVTGFRQDSQDATAGQRVSGIRKVKIAMRCNEKIALQWRLTGNSESEKKMTTSDDESADAKMTSDESSETMIEMKYMAI